MKDDAIIDDRVVIHDVVVRVWIMMMRLQSTLKQKKYSEKRDLRLHVVFEVPFESHEITLILKR
jgi:hypothetical protein